MKNLIIASILLAFSCATPSFSQPEKPQFPQNGLTPNHAVDSRNTLTKRLRGESGFNLLQPGNGVGYVDSIQYQYGEHHQVSEKQNLSFVNNNWVLTSRTQYTSYDSTGNGLIEIFQTTANNGIDWEMVQRTITQYDPSGKINRVKVYHWDESNGAWVESMYHFYDYDDHGNVSWESNNGQFFMYSNIYNQDGFIQEIYNDFMIGTWIVHNWNRFFVYDPAHPGQLVSSYTSDYWDWNGIEADSTTYSYDQDGKLRIKDRYLIGFVSWEECQPRQRQTQYFDAQNRLLKEENLKACHEADSLINWELVSVTDYVYDADGDPLYWLKEAYEGSETSLFVHRYSYEMVSQIQQPIQSLAFSLYPNPSTGVISIKVSTKDLLLANVYDRQGRPLYSKVLQGDETETLYLERIPDGSYILQVIGKDGKAATKPFVILH